METLPFPTTFGASKAGNDAEVGRQNGNFQKTVGEQESEIIVKLQSRRSALVQGSAFDKVASAVLNASARSSEAELRQAKLRAEAQSKNWLPTIGPNISLSSLGDLVASILIEQVLLDNGKRKAERAFAAADVEVAAAALSIDMNERAHSALGLYLAALRGDEKAALSDRGLARMRKFQRIVTARVEGGVSNRADQRVANAKVDDMQAARANAQEAAATARAELSSMTGEKFDGGIGSLGALPTIGSIEALSVIKAQAEATRDIAAAKAARAGLLPSLSASANVSGGGTKAGLNLGGGNIGFGTGAQLKALEAGKETAARQVAEAEEAANRALSRQNQRLKSFRRQAVEAAKLTRDSRETFKLFQAQFEGGQRTIMDVIGVYEQLVQREQAEVDAKYEVHLIELEIARDLGLLADGAKI